MRKHSSSALCLIFSLWLAFAPAVVAQQQPAPVSSPAPQPQQPMASQQQQQPAPARDDEDEVVRITANLVQVDVVVTDKSGKPITDLKAEDFEIYEDGRPQPITNFSYVSLGPPPAANAPEAAKTKPDKNALPVPPVRLRPEQVRRTIALVVDDLGLSFTSIPSVRHALRKFVDEQMQPNDLVAIIRTSAGVGALQQFTSDKRMLHSIIERVRWYPGRSGITPFAPIDADRLSMRRPGMGRNSTDTVTDDLNSNKFEQDYALKELNEFREQVFSIGTLGALNYVVNGLKELPGRKSAILFSEGFSLHGDNRDRLLYAIRRLTDLATRASVVVYTVDARGLVFTGLTAEDNTAEVSAVSLMRQLNNRSLKLFDTQGGLAYLAEQTGGFAIANSNDLPGGIRRVLRDQQGFYLIGYRPDSATFDPSRGGRRFHNIVARVKREGLRVRSRSGFYGFTEQETRASVVTTRYEQLLSALTSPFAMEGLRVRLTPLFGSTELNKPFVRALIHFNPQDITLVEEADGWRKAVVDLVALTFGENGVVIDEMNRTETIRMRDDGYEHFRRHGLVYVLNIPVKKPGAYQLRVAVRDATAKRVGSANQFIEVPDLSKNRLALSGIYMVSGPDPARASANRNAAPQGEASAPSQQQNASPPAQSDDGMKTLDAALRRFRRGAAVDYSYEIYNARLDKATGRPQLQTQFRLFREGQQVAAGEPLPVKTGNQTDMKHLRAGARMSLGAALPPGEYVLQVVVTDLLASEKRRTATQWIEFEVTE